MSDGRRSLVDKHPDRAAIEQALARRVPLRKLAKRYGITISALSRHRQKMQRERPRAYAALAAENWKVTPEELEALRLETSDGFLRQLRAQFSLLWQVQMDMLEEGDHDTARKYAAELRGLFDLIGRAVHQLGDASVKIENAVVLMPQLYELQRFVLDALRDHPEARATLIKALRQVGAEVGAEAGLARMALPAPAGAAA